MESNQTKASDVGNQQVNAKKKDLVKVVRKLKDQESKVKPLQLSGKVIEFDSKEFKSFFDTKEHEQYLDRLRAALNIPDMRIKSGLGLQDKRVNASFKAKTLANLFPISFHDIRDNLPQLMSTSVVLGLSCDFSCTVKLGVHVWLFGGSIARLGTDKHSHIYNESFEKFNSIGCFAMTEIGHGSNVRQLETTAIYNHQTKSFTINSPTPTSRKVFLGNSSEAHYCVLFARLLVPLNNNELQDNGIHGFLFRIREGKTLVPGVFWQDLGEKMGLNGTDNGYLWFNNVQIPYDALLDRFGGIDLTTGKYVSKIANPGTRFTAMLSALFFTRLAVSGGTIGASLVALSIAITYAFKRRQFGLPQQPEELLIHYTTHQMRLIPQFAGCIVLSNVQHYIQHRWSKVSELDQRELETLISGFKAFASWESIGCLQNARECSGGQGYMHSNIIALVRIDADVMLTLEGDNIVLCQQVAKDLLHMVQKQGAFGFLLNNVSEELKTFFNRTDIMSIDFIVYALKYRESRLLRKAAMRLRDKSKLQGKFAAWNSCLDHLIALAKAHMERRIIEIFHQSISTAPQSIKEILSLILITYALFLIDRNRSFYVEHSIMSKTTVKKIKNTLSKLVEDLTVNTPKLIDAVQIPSQWFEIPMLLGQPKL